jgi:hypothetical protein
MSFSSISTYIPNTNKDNLVGLSFDDYLYKTHFELFEPSIQDFWVADSPNSTWTKKQEKLIQAPVSPYKLSRWELESKSLERLSMSIGCLVSVYRSGDPWWSPALSQALALRIPVVSDWLLTSMLGESWSLLPQALEDMKDSDRRSLAEAQADAYLKSLLSEETYLRLLTSTLSD